MMLDKTKTKTKVQADQSAMIPYASGETLKAGRIRFVVDGRTPLLTHNPESMSIVPTTKKGGTLAIKGESFRGSILGAAGAWKVKRQTMKSLLTHITIVEELLPLTLKDGTPISSYTIDARRAIIQKQGIIRRRPRFDEWSCAFTIEYDPLLVTEPKLIADILQDAGGRIGVADYRPAKNGWFGRYSVRGYQILD